MRKILTLVAVAALAGCGGGGGGGTTAPPVTSQPTTAPTQPQSNYVTPKFTIRVPARAKSGKARQPQYISSSTLSVVITLTADSVGIAPGTLSGNPATTTIPAGTCNSGCTVAGPPSPPGTDSFTVVTYDNATPASGHPLNAAQLNNVTVTAGSSNSETLTLGAIPVTLSISNLPTALNAGTQGQSSAISVVADDADGNVIPTSQSPSVFYVDDNGAPLNITVSDPDTAAHGSCLVASGTSSCTSGAATSATFSSPDTTASFAYDGLAENPVTLTASASTATSATGSFQPNLNAPAFNASAATPAGVALSSSAEIDLFTLSGVGSTGTESFTESGWTNTPYGHALSVIGTPACTTIATVSAGSNDAVNGTPFTATVVASPSAGSCTATVGDGLSSNTTDGSATLTVTYTTAGIGVNGHRRN